MIGTMIKPHAIAAYIVKKEGDHYKYLLMRRASKVLHGTWQMVTGGVEEHETAKQAALREVFEETGLKPTRFYSADAMETFYDISHDLIKIIPVFVAFVEHGHDVILSPNEHDAFKWLSCDEALKHLDFAEHKRVLRHIDENYVKKAPFEYLRINQD